MKSIEEVKEYLVRNRTDDLGSLDLSGLEFDGIVNFSRVKANVIFNENQTADRIYNQNQKAEDGIYNYYQKAEEIDNEYQIAVEINNDNQQLTTQRKEYTIKIIATDEQIERIKRIVNEER